MRVGGQHLGVDRDDRQEHPAVGVPGGAEGQPCALGQSAEGPGEREHDLVVLDRVDQTVLQLVLHAEELVEVCVPGAALLVVAAGRVGDVDGRAVPGALLQGVPGRREQLLDRGDEVEPGAVGEAVALPGQCRGRVGEPGGHPRLAQRGLRGAAVLGAGEGVEGVEVGGDDQGGVAGGASAAAEVDLLQDLGERPEFGELRLGRAAAVGQPEVHLEGVVQVGRLVRQVVVVGVVPGDPAAGAGQQRVVQGLAVVVAGVGVRDEVAGHAELLQHDRGAEGAAELADPGGGVVLADRVVLHPVDVRAEEVADLGAVADPEAVVVAGVLQAPGAVAEGHRLGGPGGADGVDDRLGPGGDRLDGRGPLVAVDRHLVGDQPAGDGGVVLEAADHLLGEPGLAADHPHIVVEVAVAAPGGVPVLAGHVADDEGGDGGQALGLVAVEEVGEVAAQLLVHAVGGGHEVRPVVERAGDVEAVLAQRAQFGADQLPVVAAPHQRATGPGPVVDAQPGDGSAVAAEAGGAPGKGVLMEAFGHGGIPSERDPGVAAQIGWSCLRTRCGRAAPWRAHRSTRPVYLQCRSHDPFTRRRYSTDFDAARDGCRCRCVTGAD